MTFDDCDAHNDHDRNHDELGSDDVDDVEDEGTNGHAWSEMMIQRMRGRWTCVVRDDDTEDEGTMGMRGPRKRTKTSTVVNCSCWSFLSISHRE